MTADDDDRALEHLPEAYSQALNLRGRGLSPGEIADHLNLEREAGDVLLRIAEAKLARIRRLEAAKVRSMSD